MLGHVVPETGMLHERLPALGALHPLVSRVDPLVYIQGRPPQKRLLTILAVEILRCFMRDHMPLQISATEAFEATDRALNLLAQHVEAVPMGRQLFVCVEQFVALDAFVPFVEVVFLYLVEFEASGCSEVVAALLAFMAYNLIVFVVIVFSQGV